MGVEPQLGHLAERCQMEDPAHAHVRAIGCASTVVKGMQLAGVEISIDGRCTSR